MIRNAIRFSATPAQYSTPAPALGADSAAVRAWLRDGAREGGDA
jgi:crotonobetainyl-CoA:carnitine CoA-transferase CaiB-like acyl-CoA transferase